MPGQPWALAALLATIAVHLDVGWTQAEATTAPDCVYAGKEFIISSSAEDLSGLCTTDLPTSLSVAFTLRLDSSDLLVFKAELVSDTAYYLTAWVDTTMASLVWEVDLDGWQQVEVPILAGETHRYLATFSTAGHMQIFKNGNLEGELASGLAMPAGGYSLTSGGGGVGLIKDLSIFHEVVAWASAETAADTATSSTTTTDMGSTTTLTSTSSLSTSSTSASSTTSSSSRSTSSSSRTRTESTTSSTSSSSRTSTETTTSSGSTTTSSTSSTASSTSSSTWTSTSTGTSTRTSVTRSSTTTASTTSTLSTSGTTLTSSSTSSTTSTSRTSSRSSSTSATATVVASSSSTTTRTRSTSASRTSSSGTLAASSTTTGTRTTGSSASTALTSASSSFAEPAPETSMKTTASTTLPTSPSTSSRESPSASTVTASSTASTASWGSPETSSPVATRSSAEPAALAVHFTSPAPAEEPGATESTTSTLTWVMSTQSEQEEVLAQGKEAVPQGNSSETTTMPGLSMADQVAALQRAADEATRLLRGQLQSNETSISMELPGGAVASVTRLNFGSEAGDATSFTVAAPGSATQVILPKALVAGTLAAIDAPVFLEVVSSSSALGGVGRPVLATVSLSLKLLPGDGVKVGGLPEPVQFTVPVNYTRGLTCVYWDESLEDWSTDGVSNADQNGPGKPFSCATRHFTLFGVIFQGFVETLSCAKFTLFTSEGLAQLSQGDWYKEPSVLIYWCSLGSMLLLMAWAAFLDRWRNLNKHWTPESLFLLPQESERETVNVRLDLANAAASTPTTPPARRRPVVTINSQPEVLTHDVFSSDEEPADELKTEASYAKRSSSKTPGRVFDDEGKLEGQALTARNTRTSMSSTMMTQSMDSCAKMAKSTGQSLGMKGLLVTIGTFCMENTVRDACDEIFSDWFEWFSELRGSAEEVCTEMDMDWMGMIAASHFAMSRLVVMSSARVTAASLGLSWDLVICVLEEEEVKKLLAQRHYFRTRAGQDPGPPSVPWSDCLEREDVWSRLHADICESVTHNVSKRLCMTLPLRIFANYLVENPIGRICAVDLFMSSKMRALLFLMEFLGAMMVVSLFFANSGNMKGRPKAGGHMATCGDASLQDEITYKLGRAWAVAVGSVILSGIPVSLLSSLRTVSFKTFEEERGIPWQQQLRRWQIQGCMVWFFGTLYVLFAAFFCALFLANLSEDDLKEWTTTLLMSIAWDLVLVPLVKVTMMSSLAESLVVANAWHAGVPRGRMVGHVQQHLFLRTNIRLPIMSV